jgi:uncharacterized membrane protein
VGQAAEERQQIRAAHGLALKRALAALGAGVVVAGVASRALAWQDDVMAGWDAGAIVLLTLIWTTIRRRNGEQTAEHALVEDDSRATTDSILLIASAASLAGVLLVLVKAANERGGAKALSTSVALVAIAAAWLVLNTLFTLRYARLYYEAPEGGIDFHSDGDARPQYSDFAYLSFTVGATFQVSDTEINAAVIRSQVLRHSLLAYVFGAVIIATTINVLAGLLK